MASKRIKGITIELGGDASKLIDALKDSEKKVTSLQFELKSVERLLKFDPTNTELLAQKQAILTSEIEETTKKMEILKEAEKQVVAQFEKGEIGEEQLRSFQREIIKTQNSLDDMKGNLSSTEKAIEDLANGTSDARKHTSDYEESVEDAKKELVDFKDVASNTFDVMKNGAVAFTAAAGAVGAFGGYATNAADDFEQAFNTFQAKTGATANEMESLETAMKNIYNNNFGESIEDVADAMSITKVNTKLTGEELEKTTEYALLMRDTFEFEVNESTRTAKMLMDQYGLSAEEAYNFIAQGAQNGLDKNGDLLDTINEYGVHFAQLGLSAEDMFNMLVNGAENGTFSVDKLGDAVKEFGIRVKDGTADDAFKELGFAVDETKQKFAEGGESAKSALQEITTALFAMEDPVAQNLLGVELFGTTWEDLGAEGVKSVMNMQGELSTLSTALNDINEIRYDDLNSALQGTGRILQTSFIMPIGEEALPIFTEFANTLSEGAKEANGDIGALADTFGEALEQLVSGIGELIPNITTLASELILGLADGLVSSAPQIVTAGIGLVENLVSGFNQAIPQIAEGAIQIMDSLLGGIVNLLPNIVEGAVQIIVSLAQGISKSLPELVPQIVNLMLFIVQTLAENIPTIISAASQIITGLANGLIQSLPLLAEQLPQIIVSIINGISETLPLLVESAGEIIVSLVTGLLEALPILVENLPQIVIAIVEGLAPANTEIATLMWDLLNKVNEILLQLPGVIWNCIVGAVTKLVEWGAQLREKAENAMNELCQKVTDTLETLPEDIWNFLLDIIEKMISWGIEIQNEANAAVGSLVSSVVSFLSELPEKIFNAIIGAVTKVYSWGQEMKTKASDGMLSTVSIIFTIAQQIPDKVKTAIAQAIINVMSWGSDMVSKATTAMGDVADTIKGGLDSVPDTVMAIGTNIVEGLWQGIQNSVEWIKEKVGEFACQILDGMKESLGIHSPSRVFRDEVGKYIAEGIGIGILENENSPLNALEKLGDDMMSSAKGINGITLNRQLEHTFSGEINTRGDIGDLVSLVSEYFPKLVEASQKSIVLDSGILVGETINKIDEKLASNYMLKARGI